MQPLISVIGEFTMILWFYCITLIFFAKNQDIFEKNTQPLKNIIELYFKP